MEENAPSGDKEHLVRRGIAVITMQTRSNLTAKESVAYTDEHHCDSALE